MGCVFLRKKGAVVLTSHTPLSIYFTINTALTHHSAFSPTRSTMFGFQDIELFAVAFFFQEDEQRFEEDTWGRNPA